eukprot:15438890-Alexandrium_andersonii.AAC.1
MPPGALGLASGNRVLLARRSERIEMGASAFRSGWGCGRPAYRHRVLEEWVSLPHGPRGRVWPEAPPLQRLGSQRGRGHRVLELPGRGGRQ